MSVAKHNKRNRRGKVYLSHSEWKKRQNVIKAKRKYDASPNRILEKQNVKMNTVDESKVKIEVGTSYDDKK